MKIALETTAACRPNRSGVGIYVVRLVDALIRRAGEWEEDDFFLGCRLSRWKNRGLRYQPPGVDQFWIQEPLWPLLPGCDVVHGLDARVPHWRGAARVATLHDLATLLFPKISSQRFRKKITGAYRHLARSADVIIADSEVTRSDFLRLFDFPPERVEVVHLGVDEVFRPQANDEIATTLQGHGLEPGYVFYVGEISHRKNSRNLIEGYALSAAVRDRPLVIAGAVSFGGKELLSVISSLGIEDRVRLLGYVPDAHLPALYAGAGAFLYPTHYEGFGIPVLEGMACGVPVVGGNRGSVPEVAGGHAVLADPEDPHSIASALDTALAMTPEARDTARLYAGAFTWDACAEKTRAVYQRALALH